jgi:hypothetical protein
MPKHTFRHAIDNLGPLECAVGKGLEREGLEIAAAQIRVGSSHSFLPTTRTAVLCSDTETLIQAAILGTWSPVWSAETITSPPICSLPL